MRILFINYEFPPIGGGGANANARIFDQYAKLDNVRLDLVTSNLGDTDEVYDYADNIRVHRLSVGKKALHLWTQREILVYLWRAFRYTRRLTRKEDYDIVHAFFGFPSGFIAYLMRSRMPYLVSLRGSDVPGFNARFAKQYIILKPIFRRIWRNASNVIANSIGLRDLAHDFMPDLPIPVIPNGVNTQEFRPAGDDSTRTGSRILCVSRLIERKGVHHLIDAMPEIVKTIGDARLTVIGEGDYYQRMLDRCESLGIRQHVDFRGYVPHTNLAQAYREADIYVQPSFYEGMSNTVLEAMASGLPIVVSGGGGKEELYRENCQTVAFGDSKALADAIVAVLQDGDRARRMGEVSRDIAVQFSWATVADSYVRVYEDIVRDAKGAA